MKWCLNNSFNIVQILYFQNTLKTSTNKYLLRLVGLLSFYTQVQLGVFVYHVLETVQTYYIPAIQEEIQMELRMPNKTTVTKILTQQQNIQIAFQRKATPQNRKQDNQFMTLFPGLNLDQIRNNANTITRNSPTQPKAVIDKKISKTNSISPKELAESL
ncbi:Hypothetical_protein [Hexamita inflata]|uniref:Hypothetical_protein n=1 Tax=Hexamita inflata TaxID=28002 RepID=A0AA86PTI8_9EUKA|nr:Hypothetical protein HINF_LOCUS30923 [Hexamita inflata]